MKNKIKIKYITNARIPTEKAHGYQICKMCEEFSRAGAEVELVVPSRKNNTEKDLFEFYDLEKNFTVKYLKTFDPFKYKFLSGKLSFYIQSLCYFIRLLFLSASKEEVVFTRDVQIAWLFSIKGNKTVYEAHNWPNSKSSLYKSLIKKINLLVCNSKGTEKAHISAGLKLGSIVLPNGVDLEAFEINELTVELRKKLELPKEKHLILYVGHLYEWKGAYILLETAEKLGDNIKVVMVGGTKKDEEKFNEIVKAKKLNNVLVLGHKEKREIPGYLKSADVLALPNVPVTEESLKYTSPIKMFEYMASKKPIIASDLPSIREVLNENNSILVEPGNPDALAEGVRKLMNNKALAERISEQAYKDVQNYTWQKRAEGILSEIEKL